MRRTLLALLAGWVSMAGPIAAASGDVNGDGRVDTSDIQLIDDYLSGNLVLQDEQIRSADADGNGKITQADRDVLARRLSGVTVKSASQAIPPERSQVDLTSTEGGVVVDKQTGKPLANVEVAVPEEGLTVRTDTEGRFKLPRTAAPGKILTARTSNYAPSSLTTSDNRGGFRLELEQLSPRLAVLDDEVHHLGDDNYDRRSAGAGQFQIPAEGTSYNRDFFLARPPLRDLVLRIGSLIGVDTAMSIRAGQSKLKLSRLQDIGGGLRIRLNGRLIRELMLNGDNIAVALPQQFLQPGQNLITLEAVPTNRNPQVFDPGGFLGQMSLAGLDALGLPSGSLDYDDIEFGHLVILDPSGQALDRRQP